MKCNTIHAPINIYTVVICYLPLKTGNFSSDIATIDRMACTNVSFHCISMYCCEAVSFHCISMYCCEAGQQQYSWQ